MRRFAHKCSWKYLFVTQGVLPDSAEGAVGVVLGEENGCATVSLLKRNMQVVSVLSRRLDKWEGAKGRRIRTTPLTQSFVDRAKASQAGELEEKEFDDLPGGETAGDDEEEGPMESEKEKASEKGGLVGAADKGKGKEKVTDAENKGKGKEKVDEAGTTVQPGSGAKESETEGGKSDKGKKKRKADDAGEGREKKKKRKKGEKGGKSEKSAVEKDGPEGAMEEAEEEEYRWSQAYEEYQPAAEASAREASPKLDQADIDMFVAGLAKEHGQK